MTCQTLEFVYALQAQWYLQTPSLHQCLPPLQLIYLVSLLPACMYMNTEGACVVIYNALAITSHHS